MKSDSSFSTESETMDINTTGKTQVDCGSWKVIEGGDFCQLPGTGNMTVEQWTKTMIKLIKSLT